MKEETSKELLKISSAFDSIYCIYHYTNKKFKERGNPLTAIYRDHFELQEGYDMALKETGFHIQHPDISAFSKLQHEFHGR